jgi:hypothetical protein
MNVQTNKNNKCEICEKIIEIGKKNYWQCECCNLYCHYFCMTTENKHMTYNGNCFFSDVDYLSEDDQPSMNIFTNNNGDSDY